MSTQNVEPDNTLDNSGGAANAVPLDAVDSSLWQLTYDDRIMFETRARTSLIMRTNKALADKKALSDKNKKPSLKNLMMECL